MTDLVSNGWAIGGVGTVVAFLSGAVFALVVWLARRSSARTRDGMASVPFSSWRWVTPTTVALIAIAAAGPSVAQIAGRLSLPSVHRNSVEIRTLTQCLPPILLAAFALWARTSRGALVRSAIGGAVLGASVFVLWTGSFESIPYSSAWQDDALSGAITGGIAGVFFGFIAAPCVRLRSGRTLDGNDRMLVLAGGWLLVVGVVTGIALADTSGRDLLAPLSALAASALLASFGFVRGTARVAWVERVRRGRAPGWRIATDPRFCDESLPVFCNDRRGRYEAVLTYEGPVRGLPFRPASPTPVARVARLDAPARPLARAAVFHAAVMLAACAAAVRLAIEVQRQW